MREEADCQEECIEEGGGEKGEISIQRVERNYGETEGTKQESQGDAG